MINELKVVIVMPAYNAEKTLIDTFNEIDKKIADEIILVDDNSTDQTAKIAKNIGIKHIIKHEVNKGYGGNQKSCYKKALELNADIIIMLHPDYQYTPKLIPTLASILSSDLYDVVLASRILGIGALKGGMPLYKFIANRFLTTFQNIFLNYKLSEYHTGYRGFTKEVLQTLNLSNNSDDFIFDNQMLSQIIMADFKIAEVTCPTKYFDGASSINLKRSIKYGLGCLKVSIIHFMHKKGILKSAMYNLIQND